MVLIVDDVIIGMVMGVMSAGKTCLSKYNKAKKNGQEIMLLVKDVQRCCAMFAIDEKRFKKELVDRAKTTALHAALELPSLVAGELTDDTDSGAGGELNDVKTVDDFKTFVKMATGEAALFLSQGQEKKLSETPEAEFVTDLIQLAVEILMEAKQVFAVRWSATKWYYSDFYVKRINAYKKRIDKYVMRQRFVLLSSHSPFPFSCFPG